MRHCLFAFVCCLAALALQAEDVQPADGKIDSPTLKNQFEQLASDIIKNSNEKLPPGLTETDLKKATIEHAQATGLLKVTPDEEKAFASGQFDDAKNAAKMKQSIEILLQKQLPVSLAMMHAIKQFQSGALKGGMLEACTRMMQERTGQLKDAKP